MKVNFSFLFLFVHTVLFCQQQVQLEEMIDNLVIPVDIAFDHKNAIYVVEKRGRIIKAESGVKKTFLDITGIVNSAANERGLLGMAFDPSFATNGHFFVNYINAAGNTTIARFTWSLIDSITVDPKTEKNLMTISQPFNNHNGGCLKFGADGYLYIGLGDGGSGGDPGNRSQNPKDRLGKMLRIDINSGPQPYNIPNTNPYKNSLDTLPEIWAMGLRNPWRFSFDKVTDDLWIADVGQNKWEEVDFTPANSNGGLNYGWRCYEGFDKYNFDKCNNGTSFIKPVHTYATKSTGDGCSITGGFVYRGKEMPNLQGQYIYGDFCTSKIWRLKKNDCGEYINELINSSLGAQEVSTFGEDNNGELYVAAIGSGKVYKLSSQCAFSASIQSIDNASCTAASDGKVVFNVQSAFPYTYTLSGPSANINALKAGKYNFTLKDSIGCTVSNCFEVGIDSIKTLCPFTAPSDIIACANESISIVFPEICSQNGIDSFQVLLNGQLHLSSLNLNLTITQAGEYTFKHFKNGCAYEAQKLFNLIVDQVDSIPKFSYNGNIATVTGPFAAYIMYKDGIQVGQITNGTFTLEANNYGAYTFVGITANGCPSKPSDPLILSSIDSEVIQNILLYPNPFQNVIYIKPGDIKKITCFSSDGKKVLEQDYPQGSINTEILVKGYYSIKITQPKSETWVSMIKN